MTVKCIRVIEDEVANYVFRNEVPTLFEKNVMVFVYKYLARQFAGETSCQIGVSKSKCYFLYGRCYNDSIQIGCKDGEFSSLWISENGCIMVEIRNHEGEQKQLFRCVFE